MYVSSLVAKIIVIQIAFVKACPTNMFSAFHPSYVSIVVDN